jgi:hypothetical protein
VERLLLPTPTILGYLCNRISFNAPRGHSARKQLTQNTESMKKRQIITIIIALAASSA